jgi:ribonuclease-3
VPTDEERLAECQKAIGYDFADEALLSLSLTHASCKTDETPSNERLEFLGDAVLGAVISEYLFHTYPDLTEGEMTQIKSAVVSRPALAAESERLGLWRFMSVGKGMASLDEMPPSLLANVFEAVVGAIYLDGGMEPARDFIMSGLSAQIELAEEGTHGRNYKSLLQEYSQRTFGALPFYEVLEEKGPDHMKSFRIVAKIGDRAYESAWGNSKKEAEQNAARATLRVLETGDSPDCEETGK